MDENEVKVEEIKSEESTENPTATEVVIEKGGKIKRALKWVIGGVVLVCGIVGGVLLKKHSDGDDEDNSGSDADTTEEA